MIKKSWFILFLSFCFESYLFTQSNQNILLDDLEGESMVIINFCSPGVRNKSKSKGVELSYAFLGQGNIVPEEGAFNAPFPEYSKFREFKASLSFPIIRKPRFTMIGGYSYVAEQFEIRAIGNDFQGLIKDIDNQNLKRTRFKISSSYSLDERKYVAVRVQTSFNGTYPEVFNFDSRYAVYSGGLVFGWKKNEDTELGGGIAWSKNFRRKFLRVLPFIFFNKTFNDHWGIELTIPTKFNLRYNISPYSLFLFGVRFDSENYSLDQSELDRQIMLNHSEIFGGLEFQQRIIPWLWFNLTTGIRYNLHTSFEIQANREEILVFNPGNNLFIKAGLFISPPKKFFNSTK